MSADQSMAVNVVTGRKRPMIPRAPTLTSGSDLSPKLRLEHYRGGPVELKDEAPVEHMIIVQMDEPTQFEWEANGQSGVAKIAPGQVSLFPSMHVHSARNRDTREFMCLSLEPKFLLYAAHEVVQPTRLELIPRYGVDDMFVRSTALSLRSEIEAQYPNGRWYSEALANALSIHLVRHYSSTNGATKAVMGGLTRTQLRLALDFIHDHLAADVPLVKLAEAVGLSPFHFARLFKQSTGLAPHQYLIRKRVERAKEMMASSGVPNLSQIAVDVGFCDQSHLTVHFKKVFGITPKALFRQMRPR